MKNIKGLLIALFICGLFSTAIAQKINPIDNIKSSFAGMSYVQVTNGAGIGGYYEKYFARSHRIGVETTFIIGRGENEYPVYNYYYNQYMERSDKTRLNFLNVNIRYKKVLFVDKIANNFRPFLSVSAGPVIAFDPPNVPEISRRFKNIETSFSFNGTLGTGIDFLYSGDTGLSFYVGYNYLKFGSRLDPDPKDYKEYEGVNEYQYDYGRKDFSSALVRISITRRLK